MHIELVGESVEAIQLGPHRRGDVAQVIDAQLFDHRVVEQVLFEGIGQPNATHHHVTVGEWRVELGIEPHDLESPARCHRHRHAAERSAPRRFRRVEVRMRVEPEHADLDRLARRP